MDNSQLVFANVLEQLLTYESDIELECEYCGGSSIIYIDDGEWEECDYCCDTDSDTDSDTDYEPNWSDDDTSDTGYDTDSSFDSI
tara:strand:- start:178 stop:432 length:255 start_codon:yes stop_codon:yes gene_type:complete